MRWKKINVTAIEGAWSISSQYPKKKINKLASVVTQQALKSSYTNDYASHIAWWENFWGKSAIHVPRTLLEKQWYLICVR